MSKGRAIIVRVGAVPMVKSVDLGLSGAQDIVGGYVERVPLDENVWAFMNEEGRMIGLPFNRFVEDDAGNVWDLHGDFFLARDFDEALTLKDVTKWLPRLQGSNVHNPFDESGLIDKLGSINALMEGATTEGERAAAEEARKRTLERLRALGVDPAEAERKAKRRKEEASAPRSRRRPPAGPDWWEEMWRRRQAWREARGQEYHGRRARPRKATTKRKKPKTERERQKSTARPKPKPAPKKDVLAGKKKVKKGDLRIGQKIYFSYYGELMHGKIVKLNPSRARIRQTNNMVRYDLGPGTIFDIPYADLRV
jgi:hypothetical protein